MLFPSTRWLGVALIGALWLICSAQNSWAQITVVNVIPQNQSGETGQNSEPSLAVNPTNTSQVLIGAFNFQNFSANPYFFTNGTNYQTWSQAGTLAHSDETLAWSPSGKTVYTSILTNVNGNNTQGSVKVISSNNDLKTGNVLQTYTTPANTDIPDQPHIFVTSNKGTDQIYVGFNDRSQAKATPAQSTASVMFSLDGGTTWKPNVILDPTGNFDDAHVQLAGSGNSVYAAYQRVTGGPDKNGNFPEDIVVTRDDNSAGTFQALNGRNGTVVASITNPDGTMLGNERLGSDLSIAVDPNNSNAVYVAYDNVVGGSPEIDVKMSTDAGKTWTANPVFTVDDAGLPYLAVAQNGVVGLLSTVSANNMLQTYITQLSPDTAAKTLTETRDDLLTQFPSGTPAPTGQPYVGDYEGLEALGNMFYGTFSASNEPNPQDFPQGVYYNRYVWDATTGQNVSYIPANSTDFYQLSSSVGLTPVNTSIDPYFFTDQAVPEPSTLCLAAIGGGLVGLWTVRRRRLEEGRVSDLASQPR